MFFVGLMLALAQDPQDPARVVRDAVAAVEGDSVAGVEARWRRRLARDSSDRLATLGLAALAHHTYQDSIAERLYRSLLPASGRADMVAGYAAMYLARQLALRGQWLRADTVAAFAVATGRELGDSALLGEGLTVLGTVRHRTRGSPAAYALLDSAELALPAEAHRVRALVRCSRGQIHSFAGDSRALDESMRGLALADSANNFRARAACRNTIAGELSRRGLVDSAIVAYHYLIADYRRARDRAGLSIALQWRSHIYRLVGWMARARRDAEEAITEAEASGVRVVIPWAQTTLAFIGLQLGDLASAAPHAASAARLFAAQGDRYATATALGLEGDVAAASGDWAAARTAYTTAIQRASELKWAEHEFGMRIGLMNVEMREGDLAGAQAEIAAAAAVARATGMAGFMKTSKYYEGVLALRSGRLPEAERIFRLRRDSSEPSQPQWAYLDAARLAEVLVRRGKPAEAMQALHAASTALDAWRHALRDRQLRLFALQLSEDGSDPDVGVATVIDGLVRAKLEFEAFELIEGIRARELADRLTRVTAMDTVASDRAIRSDAPSSLQKVMSELPDSTALVRYVTGGGGEPTTALVVTYGDFTSYHLPTEDSLAPVIARFVALMQSGEDARSLGRDLAAALIEPILDYLKPSIRRLMIVPDGALGRLPFDALVLRDDRYLLERYSVSYVPSATAAIGLAQRRQADAPGTLVLADPRFAGETSAGAAGADVFRGAMAGRAALPRLRGSAREARAVARYSDAALVRRRADASEAWVKQNSLTPYGVLHFATHALVDEGSVTNTALALAPGDGEDGFVNAGELLNLKLAADLVVLSACRTAGGVLLRGEGVQGLANPLLAAGARSVAATWWPIGDAASVRLVDEFYAALASGLPVGDALQRAKLAALRRGAPAREWAAFTIIGDPATRAPLRIPPRRPPTVLLALIGVAAALALYGVAMRRRRTADAG
jgi:CHAT domain-containing protein/tetratricopeptide (TPR) repeat protein